MNAGAPDDEICRMTQVEEPEKTPDRRLVDAGRAGKNAGAPKRKNITKVAGATACKGRG